MILRMLFLLLVGCAHESPLLEPPKETHSDRLAGAFVDRLLSPCYRWLLATGIEPILLDRCVHYALIIEPEEPGRCPLLAFRFHLDYEHEHTGDHHWSEAEPWVLVEEKPVEYAARMVGDVRIRMKERLLFILKSDLEADLETLTYGRAKFCRMPSEHSDPSKARREDVIFQR